MAASVAIAVSARAPVGSLRRTAALLIPVSPPTRDGTIRLQQRLAQQRTQSWLPAAILGLKISAALIVGTGVTAALWKDHWKPAPQGWLDPEIFEPTYYAGQQQTQVYSQRRVARSDADTSPVAAEQGLPVNYPRKVATVSFTPPMREVAREGAPLSAANVLAGKQLRYLIGTDAPGSGRDDEVTEVSYGAGAPVRHGISIAYCNLFDEKNTGRYGPYLHNSDTAAQYGEGQIDPRGPGWEKNLREQFERRKKQGFEYIELDNPDAYSIKDVIGAIDLAASYGLKVIAKNPGLVAGGAKSYVAHPNVYGIIVEKGAGNPADMDALRRKAGKPSLPVWFVAFGSGRSWAGSVASSAKQYRNMGVTYSSAGEYGNALDILPPA
jgi:hypothetical protein